LNGISAGIIPTRRNATVRDELQERIAFINFLSRVTVSTFHIKRSLMSIERRDLFWLFSDLIVVISGRLFDEGGVYQ
jgi:hypothetical protein